MHQNLCEQRDRITICEALKLPKLFSLRGSLQNVELYTLKEAKPDSTENVLLLKNPQFLSNYYETLWK